MDIHNTIDSNISVLGKSRKDLLSAEEQLEKNGVELLKSISKRIDNNSDYDAVDNAINELLPFVKSLMSMTGIPGVNRLAGEALNLLMNLEWHKTRAARIARFLVPRKVAEKASIDKKRLLVINTAAKSTKIALFEGIEKIDETEAHLSPDVTDCVEARVEAVTVWLDEISCKLSSIDGIACRSGFLHPVPTGIYKLVPEMLSDLQTPRIDHTLNMTIEVLFKLAELSGNKDKITLITRDPIVSDEIETVERLSGYINIKRDGSGAHYLNHKAALRFLAAVLEKSPDELGAITAHLGNGISIAIQREDKVTAVVDAFSSVPSASRCGPLAITRLLHALKENELNIKDLESLAFIKGGLISLAGTDDFRTLDGFLNKGATAEQKKKIELIFEFFARQIASAALKLTADGKPVDFIALTGGLARSKKLVNHITRNLDSRYPMVLVPDTLEGESLAAGLLTSFYEPGSVKDYVTERDALRNKREKEDALIDTTIFERQVTYRKKDAPILSLDELFDATCMKVKENFTPTIGIIGADNEEAILAARKANQEGNFRIAKFKLIGDFAAINQIAYDFDLVIDNDNFTIVDAENPIDEATKLLASGQIQILMKGKLKSEDMLRGVFQYFKGTGKIKSGELISHIFVMDIPVRNKLLLITDAAVNTYPDEEKRIKILENALKVAINLNIQKPKIAIISAIESVNQSIESSMEAKRIADRFANRNDCIVEGPLSFDVAMDQHVAAEKNYKGQIRGTADVLIMPDIDAGNVLYKSLTTQSRATSAGIIMMGGVPVVLTSRGDSARSKLASIALAVKLYFSLSNQQS